MVLLVSKFCFVLFFWVFFSKHTIGKSGCEKLEEESADEFANKPACKLRQKGEERQREREWRNNNTVARRGSRREKIASICFSAGVLFCQDGGENYLDKSHVGQCFNDCVILQFVSEHGAQRAQYTVNKH